MSENTKKHKKLKRAVLGGMLGTAAGYLLIPPRAKDKKGSETTQEGDGLKEKSNKSGLELIALKEKVANQNQDGKQDNPDQANMDPGNDRKEAVEKEKDEAAAKASEVPEAAGEEKPMADAAAGTVRESSFPEGKEDKSKHSSGKEAFSRRSAMKTGLASDDDTSRSS